MPRMQRQDDAPSVSTPDRRTDAEQKDDHIEVLSDEEHETKLDVVDEGTDAARAVVKGNATENARSSPTVKRYVVVRGGAALVNGLRTIIKEGKVIDALNYDIQHLQRQGIRLQREMADDIPLVD